MGLCKRKIKGEKVIHIARCSTDALNDYSEKQMQLHVGGCL